MWSIGGAVLLEIVVCAVFVALAARRLLTELAPTRRSLDLLHHEVGTAVAAVSRDAGRAGASKQVLLRRGNHPAPR